MAIYNLYYLVVKLVGLPTSSTSPPARNLQGIIVWAALGIAIILCAPIIVRLFYWADNSTRQINKDTATLKLGHWI
jgi:hypothetical protein